MKLKDLDLERQNNIILVLEIAKIAARKLEKVTGLKDSIWIDQISEQARDNVDALPYSQIEAEIECIDRYLDGNAHDLSLYLLDSIREASHAKS